ncbi:MAG: peptidase M28 [Bacteroidia bacterium]|nr:MAG: peptidase M28 [Bacteroidia bacterium]
MLIARLGVAGLLWAQSSTLLDRLYPVSLALDTARLRSLYDQASESEALAHLGFLASDAMQGRDAGTPFEKVAATYLIVQHQRWGNAPLLPNGYVHAFPLLSPKKDPPPTSKPQSRKRKAAPSTPPPSYDTLQAWNVLAIRRGTVHPTQYVILSAHYDHLGTSEKGQVYNGADDNGSGTAVLLEAARLLSQLPPPRRSIVFFHTAAEEKGLLGAFRFVRDSLLPIDSVLAVINTDMLGRRDKEHQDEPLHLYAIGSDRATPRLRQLHEAVNALCCGWKFDYRYDDPNDPQKLFTRSDHYAFARKGVPAVFYFGGLHDDYHRPSDDVDKIEPDRLRRSAALMAALAWTLANL